MRATACLLRILTFVLTVNANVEKTIFLGPSSVSLPDAPVQLGDLYLDTLEPVGFPIIATQLPVQFPTHLAPHGLDSWYLLRGLEDGRRYEVRICWPAFQPTDFWLHTYQVSELSENLELKSSFAIYNQQRQASRPQTQGSTADTSTKVESILFLRIQAAASYFTTNETLMANPLPVDVDIILDPFILNILPQSLGPTAIYITVVAVGAWFLAKHLVRWLIAASDEYEEKDHKE